MRIKSARDDEMRNCVFCRVGVCVMRVSEVVIVCDDLYEMLNLGVDAWRLHSELQQAHLQTKSRLNLHRTSNH